MKLIKSIKYIDQVSLKLITLSSLCCIGILVFRIKYTQSLYFLFLLWNLFLAFIPLGLTMYIRATPKLPKWTLIVLLTIWLLFLPNAPYIITDLMHLRRSASALIWLDVLVIGSFAFTGLIAFYITIMDFKFIIKKQFKFKYIKYSVIVIYFLCGFGAYLGRYLRFNSWDIISQPATLFDYIFDLLFITVDQNLYLFSFFFGMVLWLSTVILDQIRTFSTP